MATAISSILPAPSTTPSTTPTPTSPSTSTTPQTSTTTPSTSQSSLTTTPNSPTSTTSSPNTSPSAASDSTISTGSSGTTTSVFQTTSLAVSDGVTYTTVLTETTTLAPGSSASFGSPSHQNNTGAIVGGVVGGVGGLAALLLVIFLMIRWKKKRNLDKEFDGDFDPRRTAPGDRTSSAAALGGTLPNVHVPEEDDGMGGRLAASDLGIRGTVTPFYDPRQNQTQMSEKARLMAYEDGNFQQEGPSNRAQSPITFPIPHSASMVGSSSSDAGYQPTVGSSSIGGYYSQTPMQPQQQQQQQRYHSPTSSEVASSRGAKDREGRPTIANPDQVIVHQDGGRLEEIPPTYDSLPPEDQR